MNSEEKESKEETDVSETLSDSHDNVPDPNIVVNDSPNPFVIIMEEERQPPLPPTRTNPNISTISNISTSSFFLQPLLHFLDLHTFSSSSSYSSYSSYIDESIFQDVVSESMDSYWSELNRQDSTRRLLFCRLGEEAQHGHKEIRYDPKQHRLEKCFVCLELFIESEILILLFPCGHLFHVDCIQRAIQFQTKCPLCRQEIHMDATTISRK